MQTKGKGNSHIYLFPINVQNTNKLKISGFVSVIQKDDQLLPWSWS